MREIILGFIYWILRLESYCNNFINFILLLLILPFGCTYFHRESDVKSKGEIAAYINNEPIYLSAIDKSVKQELFDELYRVFIIRKAAINEVFKEYMLKSEAAKNRKSKEEIIKLLYIRKITSNTLKYYTNSVNIVAVPELKRTLRYYDKNSTHGKELILESFKKYLLEKYYDSLKTIYKPRILIEPPLPPKISIVNISSHYRGNLESKITLLEVSDMECDKCREFYPVYEKIYKKYYKKIKFGFTHFSTYVTLCALASECAGKQDKFWEMHDSIMCRKRMPDTTEVFQLAKTIHLNIEQFSSDFYTPEMTNKIEYNFKLLKQYGLFGTPTILINGKPIFNSSSQVEIERLLDQELGKL